MDKSTVLPLTLTAGFGVAGLFGSHLPPIYEARQMSDNQDFRATEISLLLIAGMLAFGLAYATDSPVPVIGTFGMALGFVAYYEWAIRANGN